MGKTDYATTGTFQGHVFHGLTMGSTWNYRKVAPRKGLRCGPCLIAPALPELLWLPTVWRCPYIEIAFSTLDCSIVPTCGAWGSATAAKRGPLKQSWAGIQHSRDGEPLGALMQMRNVRVNGFFFFSSFGVLPGVLVDILSLCSGNFCVECVLIVLHKFYIELYEKYNWLDPGPSMK